MVLNTEDTARLTSDQIFAYRYYITHLIGGQLWNDVCGALTDLNFLQSKIRVLTDSVTQYVPLSPVFDVLRDFENALKLLPASHPMREQVINTQNAIKKQQMTIIPTDLGSVKLPYVLSTTPKAVVLYIQDAFSSYEASKHIVSILEHLINQYKLKLIFVEGGSGNVGLSFLRSYTSKEARHKVAEEYLRNRKISSEEFLDIVSDYPLTLWGIEDDDLYEKHFQAFMETVDLKERLESTLSFLRRSIDLLKTKLWKLWEPALADFESSTEAYRKKQLSMADFTDVLINTAKRYGIVTDEYPNLSCFFCVSRLEKTIDFGKADQERKVLSIELARRIGETELDSFINRTKEFKAGKITKLDYYTGLEKLVISNGLDMNLYGSFSSYLDCIKQPEIDVRTLINELDALVERLRMTLASTPQSRRLVTIDKELQLIEKVLNHHITPSEYPQFSSLFVSGLAKEWAGFLNEHLVTQRLSDEQFEQLKELENKLPNCKNDYDAGLLREEAMIKNTLIKLDETKEEIAVLIAGGFHTPRIVEGLKDHGIGVLELTPKMDQPGDENLYLSVLRDHLREEMRKRSNFDE